jgi:hypothetical protein
MKKKSAIKMKFAFKKKFTIKDFFIFQERAKANQKRSHRQHKETRTSFFVLVEIVWVDVGFRFENPHRDGLGFSDEERFDVDFTVDF